MQGWFVKDNVDMCIIMDCNAEIIRLIESRFERGRQTYGHGVIQNSGTDWVKEALEEALDLSIYLSAKLIEIQNKTVD